MGMIGPVFPGVPMRLDWQCEKPGRDQVQPCVLTEATYGH